MPTNMGLRVLAAVLDALDHAHGIADADGRSLGIVHRDVSPSNVYVSKSGTVKLGDFGIARSTTRPTLRSDQGHVLKGKFAYLAPEQVAGEPSDHRADLFSLATVLAEMLLNRPLFPGGGQLAILLAIRDCKIDALSEIKPRLPPGLFEVMQRALARKPADRYESATAFANALSPFEADPRLAAREIASRVRWVKAAASTDKLLAQRDEKALKAAKSRIPPSMPEPPPVVRAPTPPPPPPPEPELIVEEADFEDLIEIEEELHPDDEVKTSEYELLPSRVLKMDGTELGPWTFARLMEALATGQIQPGDRVDFVGRGFMPVEEIDEFARFFPATGATTSELRGPGAPDFRDQIGPRTMLETLMLVLAQCETGVLFAEHSEGEGGGAPASRGGRKELYFVEGKLHHVASSNSHELLGEYLVRRNKLAREELDLALAVLPRYGGRMGDTLISMGLVGPVDIFRAIRDQGRDRVADLFLWRGGQLTFYRGHTAPHVEFPLDLELPALMLAGLETAKPGDAILDEHRANLDKVLGPAIARDDLLSFEGVTWPNIVTRVLEIVRRPATLREILTNAAMSGGTLSMGDLLRAIEILLAAGLVSWR
jgi:hypothetical protein